MEEEEEEERGSIAFLGEHNESRREAGKRREEQSAEGHG